MFHDFVNIIMVCFERSATCPPKTGKPGNREKRNATRSNSWFVFPR